MTDRTSAIQGLASAAATLSHERPQSGATSSSRSDSTFARMLGSFRELSFPAKAQAFPVIPLERGLKVMPIEIPKLKSFAFARQADDAAIPLHGSPAVDESTLRDSARKLVASALLMPILEEMENSALRPKDGPFARNVVEKRFGPILHQNMADRMMQSRGRTMGLVDAVIKHMGGHAVETTA